MFKRRNFKIRLGLPAYFINIDSAFYNQSKRKQMNLKSCFTLLMGMALASITFAQETITLKFNPQKGTSVSYTISTEMHNKMMGMDNPMSMEMKMTGLTEEADSGRIKMVNQFNSIKISMTMMGQNINYDSENPTNDNPMAAQFGQSFGQILNKPITYIMNTDGSIHKLEGFDNLRQGMGMGVDPNQFAQGMALFPKKPSSKDRRELDF